MFEYKGIEKFDIGAGFGKLEYDFFTINNEDDFWELMNHYGAVYRRFNYYLEGYNLTENNSELSPVVQAKMKEHNANLSLTFLKEEFIEKNAVIRQMIVNEQKPDGIYETYHFIFYQFDVVRAKDFFECGRAYAESDLHNAAIKHFSYAIKLNPNLRIAFKYRGVSYLYRKLIDKAIEDFTQAIEIYPVDPGAFSLRGLAYMETGDLDKAKADLIKSLELNPDDKKTRDMLEDINKKEAMS